VNGKPRQKIICGLGHIGDKELGDICSQHFFWSDVRMKISDVELERDEDWGVYERIMDKIREVVPEPSEEDYRAEWDKRELARKEREREWREFEKRRV
jgi:hypothetical protein